MPNARKKTKTFKGAWLEEETIEKLKTISDALGTNFTTLLEKIASGDLTITRRRRAEMAHQETPEIKMLGVKLTQSLYRAIEKEAAAHKMNVSEYVRHLIVEETINTTLTEEDYAIIKSRIEAAARRITRK